MQHTVHHALVETALGWIGLAWSGAGLVRLQLPARDREETRAKLLTRLEGAFHGEPDTGLVERIRCYATGEAVDFSDVAVDLSGVDAFRRSVYSALRQVGHGETVTYGELGERAGFPGLAREIGVAMARNPVPLVIPCHRVLAAGGKIGGFSAPGGATAKTRMLELERARTAPPPPAQGSFAF